MAKKSSGTLHAKNALQLLKADHEQVLQLFSQFEKMKDKDEEDKRDLVENVCSQLTIHTQLEEELLYPALRDVFDEQDLLNEAQVEHDMAKQLIGDLESMEPDEDLYDAKFTVLGEYVKHHIEEEENEIFPKAKNAPLDLVALGTDLRNRKQELMAEIGMELVSDEEIQAAELGRTKSEKKPARHPRA